MKLRKFLLRSVIISLSLAAVIGIVAFLGLRGDFMWQTIAAVSAYSYFCLAALAASFTLERKRIFPFPWIGIIWAVPAYAWTVGMIWWERWISNQMPGGQEEELWTVWAFYFAFFCAHVCLLWFPEKVGRRTHQVRWVATVGAVAVLWFITDWAFEILEIRGDNFYWRCCGALAIFTGAASIVFPILLRFKQVERVAESGTIALNLKIECPRCQTSQTVPVGRSRCPKCELGFEINIEEPRCPNCEYLLHKLESNICPECGTAISD